MLRVGLTGGIACGKSTAAAMLRDREIQILDADTLVHELFEPGQPVHDEVIREFGPEIVMKDQRIDRGKLGAIVFSDPARLSRLNRIVHPRVTELVEKWFAVLDRRGGPPFAVVEAALLLEAGFRDKLDRLIVVRCEPQQQVARLRGRGMSEEHARQRIAAQMPIEEKARLADDVIDSSGSLAETERQIGEILATLTQFARSRGVQVQDPSSIPEE